MRALAVGLFVSCLASLAQEPIDPSLRAAIERFYATQQAEDLDRYLALWASTSQRPQPPQLRHIFDSGDDQFSGLTILRVNSLGDRTVVRASVIRDRTTAMRRPDGVPMTFHTVMNVALTFVRENGEWKILREGTPADALADAVIAAGSPEDRDRLIAAEPDLAGPALVLAVSRQADALAQRHAYAEAQKLYELALDLATRFEQPRLQGESLQNIGNALYYQRNFPDALAAYQRRLAIERSITNDEGIANALLGMATVQYSQFEYTGALTSYRQALEIHERRGDTSATATALVSTGNVLFVQGDFAGAGVDYQRSRALYLKVADNRGETRALDGLGRAFAAQGDFAGALVAYSGVLEQGRASNDRTMQGRALASMGEVHFRMGNLDTARGMFDQSRVHYETLNDLPNVGGMWQAIALMDLAASRFADAEQEYGRSNAVCKTAEDSECVARAIVGLAFAQAAQEHFEPAILSYRKAIAAFTSLKKREDAARAELGLSQALTGARDYAGALAAAVHAHNEGTAIARDDVVWRALVAQSRALRRIPDSTRALTAAADAVAVVERIAGAALERPNEAVPADTEGAYALLAVLQAEAGAARQAFATVERRRVHSMRNVLATNERDIARGMTAAERDDERQLAAEVVTAGIQLKQVKALPKPDARHVERLEEALVAAVEKRRTARLALFTRLPDLPAWRGLSRPATLDEAAGTLRADGDLLVEFVIDDDDLLVVTLGHRADGIDCRAYVTPIARQRLASLIARVLEPATLRNIDAWRLASAELVAAVPAKAWAAITAAPHAIVVPDDVLWRVPFEALPVEAGVLADRTTIVYAGSATSLVRAPEAPTDPDKTGPLLIVAAPQLPEATRERVKATSPGWILSDDRPADAEARTIAALFDDDAATTLSGAAATEAALRDRAAAASILHVAAPFRINGASPLFSPMLLARGPGVADRSAENDGVLEMREIMNLDLHARAAILSDRGTVSMRGAASSTGIVRWAWRAAGVPALILPRWGIDPDESTAMLKELYARLKDGEAPQAALQGARAAVRSGEHTRAPYYWAGWMVVGR
jgi:tetratricopeptide (TPR) repeat protein